MKRIHRREIIRKGRKKVFKNSNIYTSSTSTTSSSDETELEEDKEQVPESGLESANNDTSLNNNDHTKENEKKSKEHIQENDESKSSTEEHDDSIPKSDISHNKEADPVKKSNKGNGTLPNKVSESGDSTRLPERSDGSEKKTPKDESDKDKNAESTSTSAQPSPTLPPLSVSVCEEPTERYMRRRGGTGKGRPMVKTKTKADKRKSRPMPQVQPRKTEPEPPQEPPPTAPEPEKDEPEEETEEMKKAKENEYMVKIYMRDYWGARQTKLGCEESSITLPARGVVFVTDTEVDPCTTNEECCERMVELQSNHVEKLCLKDIAYNWLVGGDKGIYEGLGWSYRSPAARNKILQQKTGHDIYIGFIGKYEPKDLPEEMLHFALAFIHLNMPKNNIVKDYSQQVYKQLLLIYNQGYHLV